MTFETPLWIAVFRAEYYSLTTRFRKQRIILPLILFIGSLLLIFSLQLIITIVFDLFADSSNLGLSIEEIRQSSLENNADIFFLAIFMNTSTAFFIPVSVPIGRLSVEEGKMDAIISTPIKNRDLLVGTFLAELVLTAPFLCTFLAGLIAILTLSPFEIAIFAFGISYILLLLNTALGLWIGIFLSKFFFKLTRKGARAAISLIISILSLIMLFAIDSILKQGYQTITSTNSIFILFPPTWIAVVIFSVIYGFSLNIPTQLAIFLILSSLTLFFGLGLLLVERVQLLSSLSGSKVHFTPSTRGLIRYDLKISFYRYFRDQENLFRILLAFSFAILTFYALSFFLGESLQDQANPEIRILWALSFFLAILGAASTLIYVEASFFSIEIRQLMPFFLGIPNAIKRISQLKWFQIAAISLPTTIGVVLISRELIGVDLFPLLPTILLVYIVSIGLTGILLGIFGFNPVADENDIMSILNALIFFFIVMVVELIFVINSFSILTYSAWGETELLLLYFLSITIILIVGVLFFYLGAIKNQESFDLGLNKGKYSNHFLALTKVVISSFICFLVPMIPATIFFLFVLLIELKGLLFLYGSLLSLIIYYLLFLFILFLLLRKRTFSRQKENTFIRKITLSIVSIFLMWMIVLSLSNFDNRIWDNSSYLSNDIPFDIIAIILFLFFMSLAAFAEEVFFRRYVFITLEGNIKEQAFTKRISLIVSSALFALYHFPLIPLQLIILFVLGLLLGILYENTERSLFYVTGTHLCYNLGIIAMFAFF